MAKSKEKIKVTADHELVKAKMRAGLPLNDAIEVVESQIAYDEDLADRQAASDQLEADRAAAAAETAQDLADRAKKAAKAADAKSTSAPDAKS